MGMLAGYSAVVDGVRVALFYIGVLVALVCVIDWAVRTRRINPFSKVARFFRGSIDPLLAPIERVVVRGGGMPSSAAWWALVAYVVFGILVITLLRFVFEILFQFVAMTQTPEIAWRVIVGWTISLLTLALFVRVLSSWFPVSPYSRWIRWSYVLTDWMIRPLQRFVPRIGMLGITPIVAWLLLSLLRSAILG